MKIAVTVLDVAQVVHAGGQPEALTSIIELREDQIPPLLKKHLEARQKAREVVGGWMYETVSFSLVVE